MTDKMPKFEFPEAMRAFTEQSVDQAKKAFDDFLAATHGALAKVEAQHVVGLPGERSGNPEDRDGIGRGKRRCRLRSRPAALTKAKTMQEIVELQNTFLKSRMAALGEQTRVVTESAQKAAAHVTDTAKKS